MRPLIPILVLIFSTTFLLTGCGGGQSPADLLADAQKAKTGKDYDKAAALYKKVLTGKGEVQPTETQRFQAALALIECKIGKDDFAGAVKDVKELKQTFAEKVNFKNYSKYINLLAKAGATSFAVDVLACMSEIYPEKADMLKTQAEKIKEMGATPEDVKRMAELGYL